MDVIGHCWVSLVEFLFHWWCIYEKSGNSELQNGGLNQVNDARHGWLVVRGDPEQVIEATLSSEIPWCVGQRVTGNASEDWPTCGNSKLWVSGQYVWWENWFCEPSMICRIILLGDLWMKTCITHQIDDYKILRIDY